MYSCLFYPYEVVLKDSECYGMNVCVLPNSHVEALILVVMVFGGRTFGRYLGLDKVMGGTPVM